MTKRKLTIDDLLASLQNPELFEDKKEKKTLENTAETWHMIGNADFAGIAAASGIAEEEVNDFLKGWVEDNPYNNI
jgi:hypothetical protein